MRSFIMSVFTSFLMIYAITISAAFPENVNGGIVKVFSE